MVSAPASWPARIAHALSGVSCRRLRKPVWMSLASSVPAVIEANSAPCMNVTVSAKSRYESDGKPGMFLAAFRPLALTVGPTAFW